MSTDHPVVGAIRAVLGPVGVLTGADAAPFLVDPRGVHEGSALAVARPVSTAEVQTVVRACADHGVAIVPQGGNTGLSGGTAAGADTPEARRAHFVCALSLAWPDGHVESFEGKVFGTLVWPPRGDKGFGYDPIFQADGHTMTFGEMEPEAKHAMSHRADAFGQLMAAVFAR